MESILHFGKMIPVSYLKQHFLQDSVIVVDIGKTAAGSSSEVKDAPDLRPKLAGKRRLERADITGTELKPVDMTSVVKEEEKSVVKEEKSVVKDINVARKDSSSLVEVSSGEYEPSVQTIEDLSSVDDASTLVQESRSYNRVPVQTTSAVSGSFPEEQSVLRVDERGSAAVSGDNKSPADAENAGDIISKAAAVTVSAIGSVADSECLCRIPDPT
jgi:hypothetical protein